MSAYGLVVVTHVVLVILAFMAHGVSGFAMFRAKREPDRARLAAVLDLSTMSLLIGGIGLLLAVLFGIVATFMGGYAGQIWPWASLILVVVIFLAMTPMAAIPMGKVRMALGMPVRGDKKGDPPREPASDADLAAAQAALRPDLVATIGIVGIVILVWLMESKPF